MPALLNGRVRLRKNRSDALTKRLHLRPADLAAATGAGLGGFTVGKGRGGSEEVKQSYADKVKAERKAAVLARRQAKSGGGEVTKTKTSSKDAEKQASKLLTKKTPEKKVDPSYKPAKASGMTRAERMKQQRKGETMLRGIMKQQETDRYKRETGQNPDAKGRTKIMGRVHKRMSS